LQQWPLRSPHDQIKGPPTSASRRAPASCHDIRPPQLFFRHR
jgi:hypothetical protein